MNSKTFSEKEQGAGSRNDARSGAERVPLIISKFVEPTAALGIFYVSKAELEEALKFVAESPDAYIRQARLRHIFSNLIARATDDSEK